MYTILLAPYYINVIVEGFYERRLRYRGYYHTDSRLLFDLTKSGIFRRHESVAFEIDCLFKSHRELISALKKNMKVIKTFNGVNKYFLCKDKEEKNV